MTNWLVPANTKIYDVLSAFEQNETYWPMNAKITAGDTVFVYLTAPYKQIAYICDVLATDYNVDEILEFVLPFIKVKSGTERPTKPFMKLKALQSLPIDEKSALSLNNLKHNGLSGMLMGARKLENNQELLSYIKENLS